MSQDSTLKFIRKKRKWMTTKEIEKATKNGSTLENLQKLFEQKEVLRGRKLINKKWNYIWKKK